MMFSVRIPMGAALALFLAAPAAAQAPWVDDIKDYDQEREEKSEFWERALNPKSSQLRSLLAQAKALMSEGTPAADARAETLIQRATKLAPEDPGPWWELGNLQMKRERFADCAVSFARAFRLDPSFESTKGNRDRLDMRLGDCYAQSGALAEAVSQYKRILARGSRRSDLNLRIGEAYMAQGRLSRSIEFLRKAAKSRGSRGSAELVALAVAYERDERPARSREALTKALASDSSLRRVTNRNSFLPASERYYHLGTAHHAAKRYARAIIYLRHYLHAAPKSVWREHAEKKLKRLQGHALDLEFSGSAIDRERAKLSIKRGLPAVQRCLRSQPGLLFRLKMTSVAGSKKRARKTTQTFVRRRPGVTVFVDYAFDVETPAVESAVKCAQQAASSIEIPEPKGASGSYSVVEAWVAAK